MADIALDLRDPALGPVIRVADATAETPLVRRLLVAVAVLFLGLVIFLPLVTVFVEALRQGWDACIAALVEPDTLAAIRLALMVAGIVVPLNIAFGLAAGR